MSTILRTVGIDISKDWLDAFAAPERRASRFPNDSAGFRKLIAWIGSGIDRIAYEPSGAFHRDFEDTLLKAGLPLYAINPFQVRSFARSIGRWLYWERDTKLLDDKRADYRPHVFNGKCGCPLPNSCGRRQTLLPCLAPPLTAQCPVTRHDSVDPGQPRGGAFALYPVGEGKRDPER